MRWLSETAHAAGTVEVCAKVVEFLAMDCPTMWPARWSRSTAAWCAD